MLETIHKRLFLIVLATGAIMFYSILNFSEALPRHPLQTLANYLGSSKETITLDQEKQLVQNSRYCHQTSDCQLRRVNQEACPYAVTNSTYVQNLDNPFRAYSFELCFNSPTQADYLYLSCDQNLCTPHYAPWHQFFPSD